MTAKRVAPAEAHQLMQNEGYVYLDVRSIPEFDAGHPSGAYNIPIANMTASGMAPNASFVDIVRATFSPDTKIIVGCKLGGRSRQAASVLSSVGFATIADQFAGYSGVRDGFGQLVEAGWEQQGLPVSTSAEPGRSYEELKAAAGK
ncbi:MAG: rhodanese-like domain-containing protein [Polyangiales bacterium]